MNNISGWPFGGLACLFRCGNGVSSHPFPLSSELIIRLNRCLRHGFVNWAKEGDRRAIRFPDDDRDDICENCLLLKYDICGRSHGSK